MSCDHSVPWCDCPCTASSVLSTQERYIVLTLWMRTLRSGLCGLGLRSGLCGLGLGSVRPQCRSSCGAYHRTRRLLASADKFDFLWAAQEDKMDLSLYEDPSGGLSVSEATELTEKELHNEMTAAASTYDAVAYYAAFSPMVDVVDVLSRCGTAVLPATHPEVFVSGCFHDPRSLLNNAKYLAEAMGHDRYAAFAPVFTDWIHDVEKTMPLARVVSRYNIPEPSAVAYVTFLRVVGSGLWSRSWDTKSLRLQQLPSIALSFCNGRADSWAPTQLTEVSRLHFVAELFVALGQETGNSAPAFLGIQLLRANNVEVPYRIQKALTNVFAAIQRTKTEWDLRNSGQLRQVVPRWLSKYLKQAHSDALAAEAETFLQSSAEPRCFDKRGDHKLDSVCTYFQRVANVDITAMQSNIARSVSSRQQAAQAASLPPSPSIGSPS